MNSPARPPADDPLYALPAAARPHYATGMLLGARDFADEQTYHRNRLARALAFATGAGARRLPAGSLDAGDPMAGVWCSLNTPRTVKLGWIEGALLNGGELTVEDLLGGGGS